MFHCYFIMLFNLHWNDCGLGSLNETTLELYRQLNFTEQQWTDWCQVS